MALSNIFREPRREIVETLTGIAFLVIPLGIDYEFAKWFINIVGPPGPGDIPYGLAIIISMLVGVLVFFFFWGALYVVHEIGDDICNAFQRRGIHLRPKRRY